MLGSQVAIVLRAKGGNFMIQTSGIPGKIVQDAAAETIHILTRHVATAANGAPITTLDSSGDAPPNVALGQLSVLQGRYIVTHRMINAILVLVIADPSTNPFTRLRLLDACGKVLVAACKGVDVTPERLSKRYADVFMFLGSLVSGGLVALPPAFIHAAATDERLVSKRLKKMMASEKEKEKKKGNQPKFGVGDKPTDLSTDTATPLPMPDTPSKSSARKNNEYSLNSGDPLRGVDFHIPADALPPPPARAVGAKRRPPAPPVAGPPATTTAAVFKGAVDEDAENKAPPEAEGFGAFADQGDDVAAAAAAAAAAEKEKEGWEAAFVEEEAAKGEAEDKGPSIEDLKDSLQLVEIYQATVGGGVLKSARIEGAVRRRLAPFGLESARFRILPSPTLVVNACLQMAARNSVHASEPDTTTSTTSSSYGFTAALTGAPMDCSYVKYTLPSVACLPPLQVDLLVAPPSGAVPPPGKPSPVQWEGLVVLQYATNPGLQGPLLDVVVELDLAPELGVLVKASPSAQWSPNECRLRWNLGSIEPGASGMARAVVAAKPGTAKERAGRALRDGTTARVVFTGWPGRGLSGTGFEVAMVPLQGEEAGKETYHRGRILWFGEMTVTP